MKINEIFKDYIDNGIFYYFPISAVWGYDNYKKLNFMYHAMHSGEKTAAHVLELAADGDNINNEIMRQICAAIYEKYSNKWESVWNALKLKYEPIENYAMEESETYGEELATTEISKSGNNKNSKNETDNNTQNSTDTETIAGTETNTAQVAAYNSNNYSNDTKNTLDFTDRKNTKENETTNTNTKNGTETNEYSDTEKVDETKKEHTRTLRRHGNIGVTTSQQMLESELKLREYNFYNKIFADIDSEITVPVWD